MKILIISQAIMLSLSVGVFCWGAYLSTKANGMFDMPGLYQIGIGIYFGIGFAIALTLSLIMQSKGYSVDPKTGGLIALAVFTLITASFLLLNRFVW